MKKKFFISIFVSVILFSSILLLINDFILPVNAVGPYVVDTANSVDMLNFWNHFTFWDNVNDLFYSFWLNKTDALWWYASSTSAYVLKAQAKIAAATSAEDDFSMYWNGTHVHIAYSPDSTPGSSTIMYNTQKTGYPLNSSGLITWGTAQTVQGISGGVFYTRISIVTRSNGEPYVSFVAQKTTVTTYIHPCANHATNKAGSAWTTSVIAAGLNGSHFAWYVTSIPLDNGNAFTFYNVKLNKIYGSFFNDTSAAWTNNIVVSDYSTTNSLASGYFNSVYQSNSSTAYIAYNVLRGDNCLTISNKSSSWTSNWAASMMLYNDTATNTFTPNSCPQLCMALTKSVYVMWESDGGGAGGSATDCVYIMNYTGLTWGSKWMFYNATAVGAEIKTEYEYHCSMSYRSDREGTDGYISVLYITYSNPVYTLAQDFIIAETENVAPVNNACATNDLDAGDILAWRKYYAFSVNVTDDDGPLDLNYVDLCFESAANTYSQIKVRWNITGFGIKVGSAYITASGSTNSTDGDLVKLMYRVAFDWDYPLVTGIDACVYSIDDGGLNDNDTYALDMDLINTVALSGGVPTTNDTRENINQNVLIGGSVVYTGTALALPDTQLTLNGISVQDSTHTQQGTANTATGFSVVVTLPATVQLNTYHIHIDGSDADFTDGALAGSVDVVSDQIVCYYATSHDNNVNWGTNSEIRLRAVLDYGDVIVGANVADTLSVNGSAMAWDAGNSWWELDYTYNAVVAHHFACSAGSQAVFGITTMTQNVTNPQVIWNRAKIISGGSLVSRLPNGTATTLYFVVKYEYEMTNITDGTVTFNSTNAAWDAVSLRWELAVSNVSIVRNVYHVTIAAMNTEMISVLNDATGYITITWDKSKVTSNIITGNTMPTFTFQLLSNYTDAALPVTGVTCRFYNSTVLLGTAIGTTNVTGWVTVAMNHVNFHGADAMYMNLTDSDSCISYTYSGTYNVVVSSIDLAAVTPVDAIDGQIGNVQMDIKPNAVINGTNVCLGNVYWKAYIYYNTGVYYGIYSYSASYYNTTTSSPLTTISWSANLPLNYGVGTYYLNMTFWIKGSDAYLGSKLTNTFNIANPSSGSTSSVVGGVTSYSVLTIIVRDSVGNYIKSVNVTLYNDYEHKVNSKLTDIYGESNFEKLVYGRYNVTAYYNDRYFSQYVTANNTIQSATITIQAQALVNPVEWVVDTNTLALLLLGTFGIMGALYCVRLGSKEKESKFMLIAALIASVGGACFISGWLVMFSVIRVPTLQDTLSSFSFLQNPQFPAMPEISFQAFDSAVQNLINFAATDTLMFGGIISVIVCGSVAGFYGLKRTKMFKKHRVGGKKGVYVRSEHKIRSKRRK